LFATRPEHAGAAVWALPGPIFGGLLPQLADAAVAVLLLVWFINLFNFMDGIDAISGVETLVIGAGVGAVALISPNLAGIAIPGLLLAAAALGFLVWNWPRARIFLGDVGSAPLGLLLGWLLLALASQGLWLSAIILPLYYLADSGLTLMRRLMRGENITVAHRSHFYQRAVQRGRGHATVSFAVMAIGIVLVAHAAVAARLDAAIAWPALISAGAFVGLLLAWMASPARRN
ncbi:MAG: glycosyl transferase, partial [Alphaproteobacteria bacterium]|nr:glycosyl transferase [Alphaproteobacteria bacterium]